MLRGALRQRLGDQMPLLLLGAGCILLAILFATFGSRVIAGNFAEIDRAMRENTIPGRPSAVRSVFFGVSLIGRKEILVALGLVLGWRMFRGTKWWMVLLVIGAFGCAELVDWLKANYEVARPEYGELTSASHSFPSGHASGTAAVAIFLTSVAIRQNVHPWLFASGSALLTLLVGVSRIYLDKHWASDVIGGWIVGAAFGAGLAAVYEWILRYQRLRAVRTSAPSRDVTPS